MPAGRRISYSTLGVPALFGQSKVPSISSAPQTTATPTAISAVRRASTLHRVHVRTSQTPASQADHAAGHRAPDQHVLEFGDVAVGPFGDGVGQRLAAIEAEQAAGEGNHDAHQVADRSGEQRGRRGRRGGHAILERNETGSARDYTGFPPAPQ